MHALVTGAGSGIGRAIAMRLASDGMYVWVTDLNSDAAAGVASEINDSGGSANSLRIDVTVRSSVEAAAEEALGGTGRLGVVVANAGVSTMNHFLELSDDEWDRNFAVNAKGTFITLQVFARHMIKQELLPRREIRGKLITTASMAARQAAPLLVHYSASKFAVVGLLQAAAKELAPRKITVNGVNPGFVRTSMQEREVAWEAALRGLTPAEVTNEYLDATPLGRLQNPDDVAAIVSFLAGPDSDFVTGEVIEANGGAWIC